MLFVASVHYSSVDVFGFDCQVLRTKSTVVNRAPVMNAWATVVAERLGFKREEALSIGLSFFPILTLPIVQLLIYEDSFCLYGNERHLKRDVAWYLQR